MRFTDKDLNQQFRDQRDALDASALGFDSGKIFEAKRLASAVHILCHDPLPTGRRSSRPTRSLLTQLGLKDKIDFYSTATGDSKMVAWIRLARCRSESADEWPRYAAHLDSEPARAVSFYRWWNETVFTATTGKTLSRCSLVRSMRDQDGGGHVDAALQDDTYAMFRSAGDPRFLVDKSDPDMRSRYAIWTLPGGPPEDWAPGYEPVPGALEATMRQIAFELSLSIGQLVPEA